MAYWSYPSGAVSGTYPNQVLTYNYKNGTWALLDDSITFFGYFQQQSDITWQQLTLQWQQENATWAYPNLDDQNLLILAGNQEGYVLKVAQDVSRNAGALQITNMALVAGIPTLTIINHNLQAEDIATNMTGYIMIENIPATDPNVALNGTIWPIIAVVDANNIQLGIPIAGTYAGGGTVARVNNILMNSKQWNLYAKSGKNFSVNRMEFNVDATAAGQLTVDYFPSFTNTSLIQATNLGNNILDTAPYPIYPLEAEQDQLWHPVYFSAVGETVQISIYMNDTQMRNPNISQTDIQINGILLYVEPLGRLQ